MSEIRKDNMQNDLFEDDIDHEFNGYKGKGSLGNLTTFPQDSEYDRLFANFEKWLGADDFTNKDELKEKLQGFWSPFLPKRLPNQKQMNLATEYYGFGYYEIPEEQLYYYHEHTRGAYRSDKKTWSDFKTKELDVEVKEKLYHFKYGDRIVLVRADNNRILAHHKDVKEGIFLSIKRE